MAFHAPDTHRKDLLNNTQVFAGLWSLMASVLIYSYEAGIKAFSFLTFSSSHALE